MPRNLLHNPLPKRRDSVLSREQVYHFLDQGYVQVSGLIDPGITARAEAAAWRLTGADPGNRDTWSKIAHSTFCDDPDLMAVYTPGYLTAVAQIAGENPVKFPIARVPHHAYVICSTTTSGPWGDMGAHVDGTGNWDVIVESFPKPWEIFTMIYLHDVESHAGATLLWPRSHRKLMAQVRGDPERYRFFAALIDDLNQIDLGDPIEVTGKAGDVIFVDQLMVHAGSKNVGKRPRFAMNMKW